MPASGAAPAVFRQQHQRGAPASPGGVLRPGQPDSLAGHRAPAQLHRANRQSGQRVRLRLGAPGWPADRPDRAGDQCQRHHSGLPGHGPVAAHGPACPRWRRPWTSAIRATWSASANLCGDIETLRQEVSAVPVSDAEIRSTIVDEYRRNGHRLVPAHGHRAARLPGTAGAGTDAPGLGGGGYRPRRQVRHDRGAAARHPDRAAGGTHGAADAAQPLRDDLCPISTRWRRGFDPVFEQLKSSANDPLWLMLAGVGALVLVVAAGSGGGASSSAGVVTSTGACARPAAACWPTSSFRTAMARRSRSSTHC